MILDGETFEQAAAVDRILAAAEGRGGAGELKRELFASVIEATTHVCSTAQEAAERLRSLRAETHAVAASEGLLIAAAGTHPFSRPQDQPIANEPVYKDFARWAGPSARRQGVNGLHVHVGMPSADACFLALEGVLPWLPLLLALSANSPYLAGEETDLASTRAEVLAELPRSGAPPQFASYAEWEEFTETWIELGILRTYTAAWYDVRLHPKFGTLEVRMPDQPTNVELSVAFTALIQALCVSVLREPPRAHRPSERGAYQQNRWTALRFGPRARFVHPDGDRVTTVPELTAELLDFVGPAASELGTTALLAPLDPERCEGDRQLEIGRTRDLRAVVADVVERSVRSA